MDTQAIQSIKRPSSKLLTLYFLAALPSLFLFPIVFLPLFFKYHTLKYKFDDEGISASWGILFRKEIHLTYRRIQDIHVSRNVIERWLGIGKVEIQTASGSAGAELSLEGMDRYEEVRDYLYGRMRGTGEAASTSAGDATAPAAGSELAAVLEKILGELEGTRRALEARP